MSLEELLAREEIRRVLADYNMAGDRLRIDDLVEQFTADCILEIPGARVEGREGVRGLMSGLGRAPTEQQQHPKVQRSPPAFVRHHITTCQIEFSGPDAASARTYYAVYTDIGPDHCGYYADTFRKEDGRWRIAHRKARMDWRSPDSKMAGPAS